MPATEIFALVKKNPTAVATALFLVLMIGFFGGAVYVKTNEGRLALLEQRLKQQEDISKKNKNVFDVIQGEFENLNTGILTLSKSVSTVKLAFNKLKSKPDMNAEESKEIAAAIEMVEGDASKIQKSLMQTQSITKAYGMLLISIQNGDNFQFDSFVSALTGKQVSYANLNSVGQSVRTTDLQPGDLVFYKQNNNSSAQSEKKIGIYVGQDRFAKTHIDGGEMVFESLKKDLWTSQLSSARRISNSENHDLINNLLSLIMPMRAAEQATVKNEQ